LHYGIGKPKTQAEGNHDDIKQIPRMIFLNRPKDSLAPDDGKARPLRILGQIAGPNGEIIDVKTGKVLVPAPARSRSGSRDDGLGEGEGAGSRIPTGLGAGGLGSRPVGSPLMTPSR